VEQAYTTQAGAGLIAIEMNNGKLVHLSPSFQELISWIPVEARGNIRVSMESRSGDEFHSFCQSVVRDVGEPYGETFLDRDQVLGRAITVRFYTRAPGPPGLRNPEWLLMMRAVKLALVGVQQPQLAGKSPAAGTMLPILGQGRIPAMIGVFSADLSGGAPQQWTLQVAHVRYLLDLEVASGTYEMEMGNAKPLEHIATLFNLEFSKEEGAAATLFSRATAQVEYVATSALNIAQRSASWLTRKALSMSHTVSMRLSEDDTVSVSFISLFTLFGGLSTCTELNFVAGNVGSSHGGLDLMYFVADPAQPLDSNLRAALVRIPSAKTAGELDVHRHFAFSCTWGGGNLQYLCKMLADMGGTTKSGKKGSSEEDVSQLLEKLKVSPGAGAISDGSVTIRVGSSGV
jgi:hypothetical protein